MKRAAILALVLALVGIGLWFSPDLGVLQLWLFGFGLLGLTGIAVDNFLRRPSIAGNQPGLLGLLIAPSLLVAGGLWMVRIVPPDSLVPASAAAAALLGILLVSTQGSLDPAGKHYRAARFAANLILYLVVFLLFALIYHTKERSLITATATGLVALLAGIEMARSAGFDLYSGWRPAALLALIVAETTWALNYWPVSGLIGGALLLLAFYVFGGLLMTVREGRLDRRMLVEYSVVGITGMVAIAFAML